MKTYLAGLLMALFALMTPALASELVLKHGAVATTLVTQGSDGHQVGDMRVGHFEVLNAEGKPEGQLNAVLITTAIDTPAPGEEIRMATLTFVLNDGHTLVVEGAGPYPKKGGTFAPGSKQVRAITGVTGKYAGMTGWCESAHDADGNWTHTFHFVK